MTIISKEEIDRGNALRLEYGNAVTAVMEKIDEIKKDNPEFEPTDSAVAGNAELASLVIAAYNAAAKVGASFSAEVEYSAYLKRKEDEKSMKEKENA